MGTLEVLLHHHRQAEVEAEAGPEAQPEVEADQVLSQADQEGQAGHDKSKGFLRQQAEGVFCQWSTGAYGFLLSHHL